MPIFRGQRVNRTNGSGAGRGDDTHYQPPAPAPAQASQPSQPAERKWTGEHTIHTIEGGEGRQIMASKFSDGTYNVSHMSDKGELLADSEGAQFHHDPSTGSVQWGGGKGMLSKGGSFPSSHSETRQHTLDDSGSSTGNPTVTGGWNKSLGNWTPEKGWQK
jgi:hypothetical protein